jgi:hypothetical protein
MKSRFETECGCDFETLDSDQRLAALRVFANTFPLLMAEFIELTQLSSQGSANLATSIEAAPDSHTALKACALYADSITT